MAEMNYLWEAAVHRRHEKRSAKLQRAHVDYQQVPGGLCLPRVAAVVRRRPERLRKLQVGRRQDWGAVVEDTMTLHVGSVSSFSLADKDRARTKRGLATSLFTVQ